MGGRGLTDIAINNLKPGEFRREVPDPGCQGLYVVVQPSGRRNFAVRYRFDGRPTKLTLPAGISLAAARKLATAALNEVAEKRNPAAAKKQAKDKRRQAATNTVRAVCDEYLNRGTKGLRSASQRKALLERLVHDDLGDRPIDSVKRSDIVRLLDRIEDRRGPVMADMTLAVLRRIMSWHAARDDNFHSPIIRGMSRTKPRERARERILTDDELQKVWRTAEEGNDAFHHLVCFLLLTSARRNEAAKLPWAEVEGIDWTLLGPRNKAKIDLVRPLSGAAQEILAARPRIGDFVFTSDGRRAIGGFSKPKAAFDQACGVTGWTLHDLRRTARSLMSRAGVPSDHAELCLGHVLGRVRGTYDRYHYYSEKKHAFEALAAQIERIVRPQDNVVAIPARG